MNTELVIKLALHTARNAWRAGLREFIVCGKIFRLVMIDQNNAIVTHDGEPCGLRIEDGQPIIA